MMAGIISARFSVFQKLRSLKLLMLAKAKILDFTYSSAKNCSKVNASEVKEAVFPLTNNLSARLIVRTHRFILLCAQSFMLFCLWPDVC